MDTRRRVAILGCFLIAPFDAQYAMNNTSLSLRTLVWCGTHESQRYRSPRIRILNKPKRPETSPPKRRLADGKTVSASGMSRNPGASSSETPEPTQPAVRTHRGLEALREINERCLELLQQVAKSQNPSTPLIIRALQSDLEALTVEVRARAAQRGFLLVDLEFGNPAWWRSLRKTNASGSGSRRRPAVFPRASGQQLARSTLFLAWHAVRSEPTAARVMLGLCTDVQTELARLSLRDIDTIALKRHADLRPRWESQPHLWRQLLRAAQSGDYRIARLVNIRGLQLITGAVTDHDTSAR
jgi:hypothetical protein